MKTYYFKIREKFIANVRNGTKRHEYRLASPENRAIKVGDNLILISNQNRKEYVRKIGVVFGQRSQLWWDVPVIDSFELIKDIYRVDGSEYRKTLDELTERLSLSEILKTPVRQLSLGLRMRCEIAASLLHNPDILFLDEPTIGLDAVSKIAVRDFIKECHHEHGTTVILTTHDMQDIEALTERVILIGKGRILIDGPFSELLAKGSEPGGSIEETVAALYEELDI